MKTDWDSFQSEKMKQEEMDTLTDAVGMGKIDKSTNFKYFCHKMNNTSTKITWITDLFNI